MNVPVRKSPRLIGYDYSKPGAYFVTICVRDRKNLLSKIKTHSYLKEYSDNSIVGTGVLDCPINKLTKYGEIANKHLEHMGGFYEDIKISKYVIMPNHIHILIEIFGSKNSYGQPRMSVPTNSKLAQFVSTFKRLCNREYGENIWQGRFHDHIVRGKTDYEKIWYYIDTNVIRWKEDCFYTEAID